MQAHFFLTWELCNFMFPKLFFKMSSKPPLSSRAVCLCAAEVGIECPILAKVVFLPYRSHGWIELAANTTAVSMQTHLQVRPKRYREVCPIVPSDIHIFYPLTLAITKEIDDVQVFEISTEVVCKIDAMGRVAALLASGWSGPAKISFALDLTGNDRSSGRSRSLGHWSEVGCCKKQK